MAICRGVMESKYILNISKVQENETSVDDWKLCSFVASYIENYIENYGKRL